MDTPTVQSHWMELARKLGEAWTSFNQTMLYLLF